MFLFEWTLSGKAFYRCCHAVRVRIHHEKWQQAWARVITHNFLVSICATITSNAHALAARVGIHYSCASGENMSRMSWQSSHVA